MLLSVPEFPPVLASLYIHIPFCVSKCKYCDFWQPEGGDALYLDGNFFCAGAVLSEEARINREAEKQIDYRNRFGSGLGLY